jgi:hypothetical protein
VRCRCTRRGGAELSPGECLVPVPAADVTSLIRSYLAGVLTLDALCRKFRNRRWPRPPSSGPISRAAVT